jgi:hypothetical protein
MFMELVRFILWEIEPYLHIACMSVIVGLVMVHLPDYKVFGVYLSVLCYSIPRCLKPGYDHVAVQR